MKIKIIKPKHDIEFVEMPEDTSTVLELKIAMAMTNPNMGYVCIQNGNILSDEHTLKDNETVVVFTLCESALSNDRITNQTWQLTVDLLDSIMNIPLN